MNFTTKPTNSCFKPKAEPHITQAILVSDNPSRNSFLDRSISYNIESLIQLNKMMSGALFWKKFYYGNKPHIFELDPGLTRIKWYSSKKHLSKSEIDIDDIIEVKIKKRTKYYFCDETVFLPKLVIRFFTRKRLTLIAFNQAIIYTWAAGLKFLLKERTFNSDLTEISSRVHKDILTAEKFNWGYKNNLGGYSPDIECIDSMNGNHNMANAKLLQSTAPLSFQQHLEMDYNDGLVCNICSSNKTDHSFFRRDSDVIFNKFSSFCLCHLFPIKNNPAIEEVVLRYEFDLLEQQFSEYIWNVSSKLISHTDVDVFNFNDLDSLDQIYQTCNKKHNSISKEINRLKTDFFKEWFFGNYELVNRPRDLIVFETMAKGLMLFELTSNYIDTKGLYLFFNIYITNLSSLKEKYKVLKKYRNVNK